MKSLLIITFTLLFVSLGSLYFCFYIARKKLGTRVTRIVVYVFTPIALLLAAIYTYDTVQYFLGNTVTVSGQCETHFDSDEDKETTYIRIGKDLFTLHGGEYRDLEDGTYYCEVEATPIMYTVVDAKIEDR